MLFFFSLMGFFFFFLRFVSFIRRRFRRCQFRCPRHQLTSLLKRCYASVATFVSTDAPFLSLHRLLPLIFFFFSRLGRLWIWLFVTKRGRSCNHSVHYNLRIEEFFLAVFATFAFIYGTEYSKSKP